MAGSTLKESKRDSKGDMPVGFPTQHDPLLNCQDKNNGRGMFAAEATLLRSQHLGLGRGGSDSQHVTHRRPTLCWECRCPWLRVQRLNAEPLRGVWVGLVASPGSLSRYLSCSSLSPVFDLVDWSRSRVVGQSGGEQVGKFVSGQREDSLNLSDGK